MPFAKLDSAELYYEIEGETGPWLIFAHGGGSNHLVWWKQVAAFRDRYRCVVYDARWHGLTRATGSPEEAGDTAWRDLLGLMDALKIDRAFVNGHSMGGGAVSGLALNHPARVQGAIMSGTTFGFQTAAMQRWAGEMLDKIPKGFRIEDNTYAPDFAQREPALHYLHMAMRRFNPPRPIPRYSKGYLAYYEQMQKAPPGDYAGVKVPFLFVLAEQDTLQVPWLVEATAKAVPGAKLARIANSGHGMQVEQPEAYNAALAGFLDAHRG